MKFMYPVLFCAIAIIMAVQPVMAAVDMNPFDTSSSEPTGNLNWFDGPDESQMPDFFAALGFPYSGGSDNWATDINIPRSDGGFWQPYNNLPSPADSPGWWSPLTPAVVPVSPTASPTPGNSGVNTIPVNPNGWWSPLTPGVVPVSPTASPTPGNSGVNTIPVNPNGWWSPLTPAEIPVMPTLIPASAQIPANGTIPVNVPMISISELNLQGEYLKLKNNEMTPVSMTGWKISNGKGRSFSFIDWPNGDGSTFTFVLYPLSTVTIYYAKEGIVTATDLYWPSGKDTWSRPGDTAYLYSPQGVLVSSLTA